MGRSQWAHCDDSTPYPIVASSLDLSETAAAVHMCLRPSRILDPAPPFATFDISSLLTSDGGLPNANSAAASETDMQPLSKKSDLRQLTAVSRVMSTHVEHSQHDMYQAHNQS